MSAKLEYFWSLYWSATSHTWAIARMYVYFQAGKYAYSPSREDRRIRRRTRAEAILAFRIAYPDMPLYEVVKPVALPCATKDDIYSQLKETDE